MEPKRPLSDSCPPHRVPPSACIKERLCTAASGVAGDWSKVDLRWERALQRGAAWELTLLLLRCRLVTMFRWLLLLATGLGIIGSPVAALYCGEPDAAAMACCKRDMSNCNRPGKTEDCCHPSAASGGLVAAKVDQSPRLAAPSFSLAPQLDPPERPTAEVGVGPRPWEPAQDLSPPTRSVLRV